MSKILITGINSPLGQCFANNILAKQPESKIFGIHTGNIVCRNKLIKYIRHDLISGHLHLLEQFDKIIHIAAAVPKRVSDESHFNKINVEGSLRLFGNLKIKNNCKIINISTSSVYDDPDPDILYEHTKKTTKNKYGLSKLIFESLLVESFSNSEIQILTCRIPILLVKEVKYNFISNWIKNMVKNEPITLFNPYSLLNACVTGDDIFDFTENYFKYYKNNLICNLSSKDPIRIIDAAYYIYDNLGITRNIIEKSSNRKSQLISHDLAVLNGYKPNSVKQSIYNYINY